MPGSCAHRSHNIPSPGDVGTLARWCMHVPDELTPTTHCNLYLDIIWVLCIPPGVTGEEIRARCSCGNINITYSIPSNCFFRWLLSSFNVNLNCMRLCFHVQRYNHHLLMSSLVLVKHSYYLLVTSREIIFQGWCQYLAACQSFFPPHYFPQELIGHMVHPQLLRKLFEMHQLLNSRPSCNSGFQTIGELVGNKGTPPKKVTTGISDYKPQRVKVMLFMMC